MRAGAVAGEETIARVIPDPAAMRPHPPMHPGKLDAIDRVGRFG